MGIVEGETEFFYLTSLISNKFGNSTAFAEIGKRPRSGMRMNLRSGLPVATPGISEYLFSKTCQTSAQGVNLQDYLP